MTGRARWGIIREGGWGAGIPSDIPSPARRSVHVIRGLRRRRRLVAVAAAAEKLRPPLSVGQKRVEVPITLEDFLYLSWIDR